MKTDKPKFVYVTVIQTTPKKLWAALVNPQFTQQFGMRMESDWKVGSRMEFRWQGEVSDEGVVLKSQPPKLLVYSFRHLLDKDHKKSMNAEGFSKVTFQIEPMSKSPGLRGPVVRLTVTHDGFPPNSKLHGEVSKGWPTILSSLKTLLETGQPLPLVWRN